MLTESAIEGYRLHTERTISHARYRIGEDWYEVPISRRERMADGRVAIYFPIIPQAQADGRVAIYFPIIPQAQEEVAITGVQLYSKDGKLWADKEEDIRLESVQEGVLYRFTFDLHEHEVEEEEADV